MSAGALSAADLAEIEARGIERQEIERQLALHASPPPKAVLDRPCTVGDGIETLAPERAPALERLAAEAAADGRIRVFIPASGAATRMFESLLAWPQRETLPAVDELRRRAASGDRAATDLLRLADEIESFAFHTELRDLLGRRSGEAPHGEILRALLGAEGLGLADLPKALVPFHHGEHGALTALEEQIAEAAGYASDAAGVCRLHFTLAPDFTARCRTLAASHATRLGVRAEIEFSQQSPATDTLAATLDARPFRLGDGRLLFRPGGHGALLANLAGLGADLVVIKNIDNVLPAAKRQLVVHWKRRLLGRLLEARREIDRLLEALAEDRDGAVAEARDFIAAQLGGEPGRERDQLVARLDRPLRACGMVPTSGEPGGGPFWVRGEHGMSKQIVESSQVDHDDPEQEARWTAATHFNPVDIVAALRDRHGRPYDLRRFVDQQAVFIATKSHGGEPLRALELPGLWNGAMAGWNSIFVEVPAATFAPVKTLFDLLRPEHRA
jgi:hypothetical protein